MSPLQDAYLEVVVARSAWRTARDVEGQVAHWLAEGCAAATDLGAARARTRLTQREHRRAQLRYNLYLRRQMGRAA
jgi:hypothetical protein